MKTFRIPFMVITAVALVALMAPGLARADLATAQSSLKKGDYALAVADFKPLLRGSDRGAALLGMATAYQRQGQYALAIKRAKQALRVAAVRAEAAAIIGELFIATGKYAEAIRLLSRETTRAPKAYRARAALGLAYLAVGKKLKASVVWKDFIRDWNNGTLIKTNAEHNLYFGIAAQGAKYVKDANVSYEEALKIDPKLYRSNILWGYLFMDKYNVPEAEKCFKDVLKFDPNHADAWAGRAWVEWYAARPKRLKGRGYAKKALKINPSHIEAMLYIASMEIYDAEYAKALTWINRALKVNPKHLRALAHLGAVHYLKEDKPKYAAVEARVKAVNPQWPDFYYLVSLFAKRHHLYADVVTLNKKAKSIDSKHPKVLAELGIALLRTGNKSEGVFWLKEAWNEDSFNHRTKNLLNLYDDIAKKYVTFDVGHFKFQVPKDEVKLLKRYVPQELKKALARYQRKYGWTPPGKIHIELYESSKEFTVRTFGEPHGGGILGVCFGPVITALSPSIGRASWAMVLSHELAHTVHIAMSRNKVPRWFTEGLAEYETIVVKPHWKREHARQLFRAVTHDAARGIATLNFAFSRAKSGRDMVLAYYQSSQVIRFMAATWGFKVFPRALKLFGTNKTTVEVIKIVTGLAPAAFDARFKGWVAKTFAHYGRNFDPLAASVVELKELKKRAKAAKGAARARAQANLAVGYMLRRKRKLAEVALQAALKLNPKEPVARFLQAGKLLRQRKTAPAKALLEALIKEGHDGFDVRTVLAKLALRKKQVKSALAHLLAAQKFDPEQNQTYDQRIRLFAKQKNKLAVVLEMGKLAGNKEGSAALLYSIVTRADMLDRWDIVRKFGRQAIEAQPLNLLVHEKYAWALKAAKRNKEAVFEFQSALLSIPDAMPPAARAKMKQKEAWIHQGLAECYAAMRERDKALRHLNVALSRRPNFPRAIKLKKLLDPTYRPGGSGAADDDEGGA